MSGEGEKKKKGGRQRGWRINRGGGGEERGWGGKERVQGRQVLCCTNVGKTPD